MKISINWLKDHVDLSDISTDEIIKRITLSTAEIEEVFHLGKNTSGVVVGKILSVADHPNSKKLHLLKVDKGDEVLDIVCGAPNVREGMKVALATIGGEVSGFKISKASIAGMDSYGMCCSKKELGIGEESDGIWDLDPSLEVGKNIKDIYAIDDVIFEVDNKSLTNRPDLVSHYGFARELSAIFDRPLKNIEMVNFSDIKKEEKVNLEIKSKDCLRYTGIKIGNISKTDAEENMKIRLYYAGMRSINLLTDIANYVMLDIGQPLHTFDAKYAENITIENVKTEEKFTTLDNSERILPPNTMMIKNNGENIAIAGVMGGLDSEVLSDSSEIFLESATFDASSIRKSAAALNLRSEASMRYEKSLDPELNLVGISRFFNLLKGVDGNIEFTSILSDEYNYKYPEIKIDTTKSFIDKYAGISFDIAWIKDKLTKLGFKVSSDGENLNITVPSYRATKDVSLSADIVEEVCRIYGYDNFDVKPVKINLEPVNQSRNHIMSFEIKNLLATKYNLNEVHTYIWNNNEKNKALNIESNCDVKVLGSVVKENDSIRSEMLPSLISVVQSNAKAYDEIGIFEIGRVANGIIDKKANEENHLAICLASNSKDYSDLLFSLKGMLEDIVKTHINKKVVYIANNSARNYHQPNNSFSVFIDDINLGEIAIISPKTSMKIDTKIKIVGLDIDFNKLADIPFNVKVIEEVSKYQRNVLDLNLLIDEKTKYYEIEKIFDAFTTDLEFTYTLLEKYKNEELFGDKISYVFSFEFFSKFKTLSSQDIEDFQKNIINHCEKHSLKLR